MLKDWKVKRFCNYPNEFHRQIFIKKNHVIVPAERGVINKERNAGAYRLSAYYVAKITSDLPLILLVPVIFYSIVYWMSAMGDVILFCIFLGINLLHCLVAEV